MIMLGGITRLTHSGLSMVEWKPLLGVIPPLNDSDWQLTFEKYKAFPEYLKMNSGMSLTEFKTIFYFEYFHRLLGRLIGIIFLVPFLYFWIKGQLSKPLLAKLTLIFVIGGLQGLLGWYMVKSGLINEPRVSPYRLSAHLVTAIIIYAYILWIAFGLLSKPKFSGETNTSRGLYRFSVSVTSIILFMFLSGALVAGTHAGFTYNTFPLMAGEFVPDGLFTLQPLWRNLFENIITVQFNHRILAYLILILAATLSFLTYRLKINRGVTITALILAVMLFVQISLGIATLVYVVPVALASLHQGCAVLLFAASLFLTHQLKTKTD